MCDTHVKNLRIKNINKNIFRDKKIFALPAWVGGVSECAGLLALVPGGEVGGAQVVPGLQAGVTHQARGGGAGEAGGGGHQPSTQ